MVEKERMMKGELEKVFEGVKGVRRELVDKVCGVVECKVEGGGVRGIEEREKGGNIEGVGVVEGDEGEIGEVKECELMEMGRKVDGLVNGVVEEWGKKKGGGMDGEMKGEGGENVVSGVSGVVKEGGMKFGREEKGEMGGVSGGVREGEGGGGIGEREKGEMKEGGNGSVGECVMGGMCEGMVERKKGRVVNVVEGVELRRERELGWGVERLGKVVEGKWVKKEGDEDEDELEEKVGGKEGDEEKKDVKGEGKKGKKEGDEDEDEDEREKEVKECMKGELGEYKGGLGMKG